MFKSDGEFPEKRNSIVHFRMMRLEYIIVKKIQGRFIILSIFSILTKMFADEWDHKSD